MKKYKTDSLQRNTCLVPVLQYFNLKIQINHVKNVIKDLASYLDLSESEFNKIYFNG